MALRVKGFVSLVTQKVKISVHSQVYVSCHRGSQCHSDFKTKLFAQEMPSTRFAHLEQFLRTHASSRFQCFHRPLHRISWWPPQLKMQNNVIVYLKIFDNFSKASFAFTINSYGRERLFPNMQTVIGYSNTKTAVNILYNDTPSFL